MVLFLKILINTKIDRYSDENWNFEQFLSLFEDRRHLLE